MKLTTLFRLFWPRPQNNLTDRQLEHNRIRRLMRREAYHHDKRLGRACPSIYFHFTRKDYGLLLRAAHASRMTISDFLQQAGLAHARLTLQLQAEKDSKQRFQ
jgi:hypothetical protein